VVVGKGGAGLLIEDLRISFHVEKSVRHTPNTASILIYNLHPSKSAQIKRDFTDVILKVGYQNATKVIFAGQLKRAYTYKDGTSTITEIQAADGDRDYREAYVNAPLPAGSDDEAAVNAVLASFAKIGGTRKGSVVLPRGSTLTRAKVLTGRARDILHRVAQHYDANWSIQDGQLDIIGSQDVLPGTAIVVNAETGMLGAPEITDKGVEVKMLLNPLAAPNVALKLDNDNVKIKSYQQYANGPKVKAKELVSISVDGIYKIYKLTHEGDTRGGEGSPWSTLAECVAVGSAIPSTSGKKSLKRVKLNDEEAALD
jgi:hypothetical protein